MHRIVAAVASLAVACLVSPAAAGLGDAPFRAGCAQIFVTGDVDVNLSKYLEFIDRADKAGVQLLVFPEASLSGYGPAHYSDREMPSAAVLERALDAVKQAARDAGIWVLAGTSAWQNDSLFNRIVLIDPEGRGRAAYDKAQLTDGDVRYYQPGREITTYEAGGMEFGMQICYDIRFPEPWRIQALQGAQVIFHASQACGNHSWKIPVWEGHLRSRAAENGIWIVSCNAAGPVQMGKSYIIDPDGLLVAASNQDSEELITDMVDLSKQNRVTVDRRRTDLYHLLPVDEPAGGSGSSHTQQ